MNLCSDKHGEVVYEGRNCPACVEREAKESIMEDLQKEKDAVAQLESVVSNLQEEIEILTREPVITAIEKANNP